MSSPHYMTTLEYLVNSLGQGLNKAVDNIQLNMTRDAQQTQGSQFASLMSPKSFNRLPPQTPGAFAPLNNRGAIIEQNETDFNANIPETAVQKSAGLYDPTVVLSPDMIKNPDGILEKSKEYIYGREGEEAEIGEDEALNSYMDLLKASGGQLPPGYADVLKTRMENKARFSKDTGEFLTKINTEGEQAEFLMSLLSTVDFNKREGKDIAKMIVDNISHLPAKGLWSKLSQGGQSSLIELITTRELPRFLSSFKGSVRTPEIEAFYRQAVSSKNKKLANSIIQTVSLGEMSLKIKESELAQQLLLDYPGLSPGRFQQLLRERKKSDVEGIVNWMVERIKHLNLPKNETGERNLTGRGVATPENPPENLPAFNNPSVPIGPQNLKSPKELNDLSSPDNSSEVLDLPSRAQISPQPIPDQLLNRESPEAVKKAVSSNDPQEFMAGLSGLYDLNPKDSVYHEISRLSDDEKGRNFVRSVLETKPIPPSRDPARNKTPLPAEMRKNIENTMGIEFTPEQVKSYDAILSLVPREDFTNTNFKKNKSGITKVVDSVWDFLTQENKPPEWIKSLSAPVEGVARGIGDAVVGTADMPGNIVGSLSNKLFDTSFKPDFLGTQYNKLLDSVDSKQNSSERQKNLRSWGRKFGVPAGIILTVAATGGLGAAAQTSAALGGLAALHWGIETVGEELDWTRSSVRGMQDASTLAFLVGSALKTRGSAAARASKAEMAPRVRHLKELGLEFPERALATPQDAKIRTTAHAIDKTATNLGRSIHQGIKRIISDSNPQYGTRTPVSHYIEAAGENYRLMRNFPEFNNPNVGVPAGELIKGLKGIAREIGSADHSLFTTDAQRIGAKYINRVINGILGAPEKGPTGIPAHRIRRARNPDLVSARELTDTLRSLRREAHSALKTGDLNTSRGIMEFHSAASDLFKNSMSEISPEVRAVWDAADADFSTGHSKLTLNEFFKKHQNATPEGLYTAALSEEKVLSRALGREHYQGLMKLLEGGQEIDRALLNKYTNRGISGWFENIMKDVPFLRSVKGPKRHVHKTMTQP